MGAEIQKPNDEALRRDLERLAESIVVKGDASGLSASEKTRHYLALCERLRLDPSTQPFQVLRLNGKEIFYAARGATDQLRARWGIDCDLTDGPRVVDTGAGKIICATAKARFAGRTDTSTGAVPVPTGGGEALCNALLKAETKAKRRVTLSILGLGMLDETELETIPATAKAPARQISARSDLVGDEPVPACITEALAELGCAEGAVAIEHAVAVYLDCEPALAQEERAAAGMYLKRRAGVSMSAWQKAVDEGPGVQERFRKACLDAGSIEALAKAWIEHRDDLKAIAIGESEWGFAVQAASGMSGYTEADAKRVLKPEVARLLNPQMDPPPSGSDPTKHTRAEKPEASSTQPPASVAPAPAAAPAPVTSAEASMVEFSETIASVTLVQPWLSVTVTV